MVIYKITNLENSKVYIGQTIDFTRRMYQHCTEGISLISSTILKEGADSFLFEVLFECNNSDADLLENYMILKYNSMKREFGYNVRYINLTENDKKKALILLEQIETGVYVFKSSTINPSRYVICLNDGLEFKSIAQCASHYNISASHISSVCKGKRATTYGLSFRYIDFEGCIIEPEVTAKKKEKEIYCEELNMVFPSISEACRYLGLDIAKSKSSISKCAYGGVCVTAYGYHWKWVVNDEVQENGRIDKRKKKVIVDDKYIYDSISEACRALNLGINADVNAGLACRGMYKNQFALGHKWQYLDKDNKPIKVETVSLIPSNIPVLVDNSLYFSSINSAVKYFNLNDSARITVKRCCDRDYKDMHNEAYGHSWSYVDIINL